MIQSLKIMKHILGTFESKFETFISEEELETIFKEEFPSDLYDKCVKAFEMLEKEKFISLTPELRTLGNQKKNYIITMSGILFLEELKRS